VEWCNSGATAEQRHGLSEAYHTLGFKVLGENFEERLWGLRPRYPLFLVDDKVWHPTAMRERAGKGWQGGRNVCVFVCVCDGAYTHLNTHITHHIHDMVTIPITTRIIITIKTQK
jgi:hypothetical protein